jgi:hypothetical protein
VISQFVSPSANVSRAERGVWVKQTRNSGARTGTPDSTVHYGHNMAPGLINSHIETHDEIRLIQKIARFIQEKS